MAVNRGSVSTDHDACGVGFIARLGSTGSREVVERALEALLRLSHRGGVDADGRSGDGAGLLTRIPDRFIRRSAREAGIELPASFGLGMVFLPAGAEARTRDVIEIIAKGNGLRCLGWRIVPVDSTIVGPRARDTLPVVQQCFFAGGPEADLEPLLYVLRKEVEAAAPKGVYFCSLSSRTVVYKGLLTPEQLPAFYPDLRSSEFESPFAIFHQRYSTNTQPSWSLAQPFRLVAHNGEINTISGNRRWLRAREPVLRQTLGLSDRVRLLEEGVSDSASFDNGLEIFIRQAYPSHAAMLCMVPPAVQDQRHTSQEYRCFIEAHAREHEPWDGPAALIFTDGVTVGAKLDRNGLRPLRYTVTSDGLIVVGSEVGVVDLRGKRVTQRQRLGPGEMLLANPITGSFWGPQEILKLKGWGNPKRCSLPRRVIATGQSCDLPPAEVKREMVALGWSADQFRLLFLPLVQDAQEAVWSMGDDTPPAFLSTMRRPLWEYCKQRFAQVTNPPIDPLRETHVMSLDVFLGADTVISSPLLDSGQIKVLADILRPVQRIDFTFSGDSGIEGAKTALTRVQDQAGNAAALKPGMILLSDRGIDANRAALPALLALAAAWKSMVRAGFFDVPLVIETGQVIETHHVALLIAAGASAVFPYMALQQAARVSPEGPSRFRIAIEKGLRKVLARMGISTVTSYRNSQLFEIVGLDEDLCKELFEDANYTIGGIGLSDLLQDCMERHGAAYASDKGELRDAGLYRFRHNGERHASSPELVRRMHRYIKSNNVEDYRRFSELSHETQPLVIRDLLEVTAAVPVPLHEVEPEASLLSRFSTQAMSLGAISPEAHQTLAIAMNRLGARSNTGEGGEDPAVYTDYSGANNRVKQVASARFGVTTEYLIHADELEIKIAQGAKPGEGGQLPAAKVTAYIAKLRHAVPNMALISPPPHHDIYSIEDLAQLIYDLRAVNPHARIGVKLVSSGSVGIIAAGVAKAGANVITISGYDGGTGASPLTSIKNTGIPWEIGLYEAHCALVRTGLRGRVRLRVDGGFKFAQDVIFGALLGAEEFGFGTAALLAVGCVMARQCHLNTCPVGIATQDEKLRARFSGTPEMVESYFRSVAVEVRELLAGMGACSIDEIVGSVDRLRPRNAQAERALGYLLEPIERVPQLACRQESDTSLHLRLNRFVNGLEHLADHPHRFHIANCDRAIGAHLSGEVLRRLGPSPALPVSMDYEFVGSAGQSFGAFLIAGINFRLTGEANDYVGKGLSGGAISISAGTESSQRGDVLVGNTVLYGATAGELYVAGRAGERFGVRNSGALAVVEGVGQHGCEYMTAGVVVILGPAGTNLGAGMTGGLAYLLRDSVAGDGYNHQSVRMVPLEVREELWLRRVLQKHLRLTGSPRAARLLSSDAALPLLRVEPLHRPCSIAETWSGSLKRLRGDSVVPMESPQIVSPELAIMLR